ncbi:MAG: hypothetical protein KAX10_02325 [Candidatus Lokiarchaeota archaeon]|nr:hypothetical protein [Candidatus Lokiarchaeota archaeon]
MSLDNAFDLLFVIIAITFNLLIIGIFIAGKRKQDKLRRWFGIVFVCLTIPLIIVFINYLFIGQELWIIICLVIILLYLFLELLLDLILKYDFRKKPITHVPYIILFYIVSFSLIGITFYIDEISGWIVSITFWAVLASLIYNLAGRKKKDNE